MKETLKSKKGITLIALVITIIVLIILAGISISMLMGENGLITKAKEGRQNMQNAAIEEQEMLNNLYGDFASEIAKTGSGDAVASLISFKRIIAGAITDAGVATSEDDDAETMADNIAEIYQAGVADGQTIPNSNVSLIDVVKTKCDNGGTLKSAQLSYTTPNQEYNNLLVICSISIGPYNGTSQGQINLTCDKNVTITQVSSANETQVTGTSRTVTHATSVFKIQNVPAESTFSFSSDPNGCIHILSMQILSM